MKVVEVEFRRNMSLHRVCVEELPRLRWPEAGPAGRRKPAPAPPVAAMLERSSIPSNLADEMEVVGWDCRCKAARDGLTPDQTLRDLRSAALRNALQMVEAVGAAWPLPTRSAAPQCGRCWTSRRHSSRLRWSTCAFNWSAPPRGRRVCEMHRQWVNSRPCSYAKRRE